MSDFDLNGALETYRRDGIVVLEGLLDKNDVAEIRRSGEDIKSKYHDLYGATSPVKTRGGWRLDIPPVNLVRRGGSKYADAIGRMMSHPVIRSAADAILGPHWNTTALVYDYRAPCDDPLPEENFQPGYPPAYYWHVDHGNPGLRNPDVFTLRFQVYLNDTDFETGALGYAPGTQKLVKYMRARLAAHGVGKPDAIIDTHQSIKAAKAILETKGEQLSGDMQQIYDRFMEMVPRYDFASAGTSFPGGAGSILMFDDTGMHRGNFVNKDHRYVCRCLCMSTDDQNRYGDLIAVKNTLARAYYKMSLNEPFRALM